MPTVLQFRRGTTAQNNSFTGSAGEVSIDTTLDTLRVHDGSIAGGFEITSNAATQTLTNKTLTSPKIGTSILDTNGNELFNVTATSSAVNQITYANAATGNGPTLTASGDDTNIDISILPKGSGQVIIDNLTFPAADGTADQILVTDGSGNLSFTDNSGGTSWQAVARYEYIKYKNGENSEHKEFMSPLGRGQQAIDSCTSSMKPCRPLPTLPKEA